MEFKNIAEMCRRFKYYNYYSVYRKSNDKIVLGIFNHSQDLYLDLSKKYDNVSVISGFVEILYAKDGYKYLKGSDYLKNNSIVGINYVLKEAHSLLSSKDLKFLKIYIGFNKYSCLNKLYIESIAYYAE